MKRGIYMTNEHVFIIKGDKQGRLIEVPAQEAHEIKKAGEGFICDMSEYNRYKQRGDVALNQYKALERKLRHSDDPRDGDEATKAYVLNEAWDKLSAEIKEIDTEWSAKRAELEETARQASATHSVSVTNNDMQVGSQFASRYVVRLAAAQSAEEQKSVLSAMTGDISRLTDAQRVALQSHLLPINGVVKEGVSTREVFDTAAQMQSADAVAVDAVKAFPWRTSTEFHMLRTVRDATHKRVGG